jgi:V/A-type H+-transporting ATPase subunit I
MEDPSADDNVPTLIRNPKWIGIIKPVFAVMNIVPGYREKDISPFFLLFFTIFFGILVGDAGYGTVFLLITAAAHKMLAHKLQDQSFFYLAYLLSTITIVWGILTGTVFGTLLMMGKVKPLLPWLTDPRNVQFLCFTLGVIHLTIAHIWRCVTRGAFWGALAEIGWISMLWGSYFLANMMLIGIPLPAFVSYLYLAGGTLVIMDIISQRKDIGVNMILFVFSVINTFGDIVSYIRLFAVGLAGVAVADAFNQMAMIIGFGNIFSAGVSILILAFVHLFLNLALCVMGVLVHGIRLNVLEFSGHLGMEWSGIPYHPFRPISTRN